MSGQLLLAYGAAASTPVINQSQQMDFATVAVPSGSATLTVSPSGSVSGSGEVIYGSVFEGSYAISNSGVSPPPATLEIDIANISAGSGYSFSNFRGEYDGITINSFPATGLPSPVSGFKVLKLGATLNYNSGVSVGSQSPSFDIVVNYE